MGVATDERDPANWDGYRPGVLLLDAGANIIARVPLTASPQVFAWFRDPAARPLRFRDDAGQLVAVDRRQVASLVRRDVDACVVLEQRDRERVWREDDS